LTVARFLSYPLSPSTPSYPGTPGVTFDARSRIAAGDEANWIVFTANNHAGTHVDGPWHFDPNGRRISELAAEELVFDAVRLIDLPKQPSELITVDDLLPHAEALRDADLLLLRTGFGPTRWRDPEAYRARGPGFHSSAGWYLSRQTSVRAVAMDFISATCQAHIAEGQAFHRIALGALTPGREILLIEDARLDDDLEQQDVGMVVVGLLILEDQDGGPATIIALRTADRR